MADIDIQVDLRGIDPVLKKMRQLPEAVGYRALRRALRKGAAPIRDAARNNAKTIDDPETAANIARNISIASGGRRRERIVGGPMMRVGVRGGAKPLRKGTETGLPGGNTTHWRFPEFGTSQVAARPFMRTAAQTAGQQALQKTADSMGAEMDKELAKLGLK